VSIPDSLSDLRASGFAEALEQFDDLLNREGIAFLFGAGTSVCEGMPLMSGLTRDVLSSPSVEARGKKILADIEELFDSEQGNIEDYLSELSDYVAIAERRDRRSGKAAPLAVAGSTYSALELRDSLNQIKTAIAKRIEECQVPNKLDHHRRFVASLHQALRPGKRIARSVDYLLLNYDTFIEEALALEKIPYADGIEGGSNGWWKPDSTFSRQDVAARVVKLHGSIDWWQEAEDPLPRRATDRIRQESGGNGQVLIWPASTKYIESQKDPFAQLLKRARDVLNPRENETRFLGIGGYSFGDDHINAEIESALLHTDGRLTVAVFTSQESPEGVLETWRLNPDIAQNLLVFARRGFFHGDNIHTSTTDLPWWQFENLARLVAGER
jgi:hypothetical protein